MIATTTEPVLRVAGIRKSFFGVEVLKGIDFDVRPGEVHGLVGENGAGKSTLMKIIAGVQPADEGTISTAAKRCTTRTRARRWMPASSRSSRSSRCCRSARWRRTSTSAASRVGGDSSDQRAMNTRTADLLTDLGVSFIEPTARVGSLTVAEQQIVEIVKALSFDARVISMDEPTAALSDREVELLYAIIRRLTSRGVRRDLRLAPVEGDLRPVRSHHDPQGRRARLDRRDRPH